MNLNFLAILPLLYVMSVMALGEPIQTQERDSVLKVGILRRPPFSEAEERILSIFAQRHGLSVDLVYVRSFSESAASILNGSTDIASSGLMTDAWLGRGNFR